MRRSFLLVVFAVMSIGMVVGQTMNVNLGDVTYAIGASQAGDMVFDNGKTLTIAGKIYQLSEVTSINVNETTVDDNTVAVNYNGNVAKVLIAGNLAPYITAKVNGAHVYIIADASLEKEVIYTLSGSSNNGSFYMDGNYAIGLTFNGLTLNNPDSAAVNIQDGKLITITLADGTSNSLSDGLTNVTDNGSDGHKAAFYVDGHTSWKGGGSLTLAGRVKHAYSSDEYTLLNPGLGVISVTEAKGDGFHISQYFRMNGGTVNIVATGDGIDVEKKKTDKTDNGMMILEDGNLTVSTSGVATKALKCESDMRVSGGTISATTTGSAEYDATEADLSSCAAAKCGGTFQMTGGALSLVSTGAGGKGLNATGAVTVSGGTLTSVTTGKTFTYGALDTKPQGIKSDANITLSGGTILSCASEDKGTAFKTDYYVLTNGATLMGIGGKATTPSNTSTKGNKKYTGVAVTGGQTLSYDGVTFTIPSIYSNSSAKVLVSSPAM